MSFKTILAASMVAVAMLAGGCAVGAGVTGGAVFAVTAWLALFAMWVGAGATDWLVDRDAQETPVVASAEPEELKVKAGAGGKSPLVPAE